MTPAETLILATYFFVLVILAVYGWHRYYLVYLYMKNKDKEPKPGPALDPLPVVTIQLPLYNEMYVADRLIDAVCRIEYPRELLEIQVLDDSTDETTSIASQAVRRGTPLTTSSSTPASRTAALRRRDWRSWRSPPRARALFPGPR
jgi:cellulose synthase/poly-beta-1,6-N-acetylglucosamine synthase-like glycosyltransferase